tara:strand:+ start:480 stop:743 length:264 start_codon:yes stop_codon:yes gene_type:complete
MFNKIIFYPILCTLIYNNIRSYIENKRKFKELFESLENINIRIENINKFIDRRKVIFRKNIHDNIHVNVDGTIYSSDESIINSPNID